MYAHLISTTEHLEVDIINLFQHIFFFNFSKSSAHKWKKKHLNADLPIVQGIFFTSKFSASLQNLPIFSIFQNSTLL